MPTYRYRCDRCGDELEVWQSFSEEPLKAHEGECGGELRKVLSPAGIVLKGSGFYKTDNRPGGRNGKRSDSGGDSSSKESSKESSSESDSGSKDSGSKDSSSSSSKSDSGSKSSSSS